MTNQTQYATEGYVVVRECISSESIQSLLSLVSDMNLNKRKLDLIGHGDLKTSVDALVRPLFLTLGIAVGDLVELSALVANNARPVKLGWHKDNIPGGGRHAFQIPLLPGDAFHQLVPGSQNRELTDDEITARNAGGQHMPGAVQITLDVGDVLIRSPFILHRGYNETGIDRFTIVGAFSEDQANDPVT